MSESGLDHAKSFVFRGLLCLDDLQALEPSGVYIRDSHRRLGRALSELSFAEFSPQIQDDAEKMARRFVALFGFENSARELISQRLRDKHGATWWTSHVPENIRQKVEAKKAQEQKNKWHQPRGRHDVNYIDFGDMPGIILENWADFEDLFDSQDWVKSRAGCYPRSKTLRRSRFDRR